MSTDEVSLYYAINVDSMLSTCAAGARKVRDLFECIGFACALCAPPMCCSNIDGGNIFNSDAHSRKRHSDTGMNNELCPGAPAFFRPSVPVIIKTFA